MHLSHPKNEVYYTCGYIWLGIITLVLTSGCGPSPAEKEFQQQITQTKQQCKSLEIRDEVLSLSNIFTNQNIGYVTIGQWPKEIQNVALFKNGVEDIHPTQTETTSGTNAFKLMAGSGFGHWGLIVCQDTNSKPINVVGKIVPWENGIYFWLEN